MFAFVIIFSGVGSAAWISSSLFQDTLYSSPAKFLLGLLNFVAHFMMRDTIYYLIIVIYYFWYFYAKNVILGLGDLFPCF